MLGFGLLVAMPFALALFLPPRIGATLGVCASVPLALVAGYFGGAVLGFGFGVVTGLFFGFVGVAFTGLFIGMGLEMRGRARFSRLL